MRERTYLMSNLVYGSQVCGPMYTNMWLDNQLKSLLDSTNLPAAKAAGWKLEYAIFSDEETLVQITRHPHYMQLANLCEIHIVKMNWPPDVDRFANRYGLLTQMIQTMTGMALDRKVDVLSCWVADLVFAKNAIPRILSRFPKHDSVFMVPIRGAADSIIPLLAKLPGAPTEMELFEMAYRNLHHLWVASHWDSPLFSKFPYSIVWNSGSGLVAHNFGVTPIAFQPTLKMKDVKGGIDSDLPGMCTNPYWCTDWLDSPVAGVEPLSNGHYPPFLMQRASEDYVVDWALKATMPKQADLLDRPLYYPSKKIFANETVAHEARKRAEGLQFAVRSKREPRTNP